MTSTSSYLRDIEFVQVPANTIGQLTALDVQGPFPYHWSTTGLEPLRQNLLALAWALEQAETEAAAAGTPAQPQKLLSVLGADGNAYPFDWLMFYENKSLRDKRAQHEWHLWLADDGLHLTFEHGKFGRRHESPTSLSAAFRRLAQVVTGQVAWRSFGDTRSRQCLLHKGQFYWQDPATGGDVPVDNFVFATDHGHELRLAGASGRAVLAYAHEGHLRAHEWFDDYAEGLRRMADVLAGYVDMAQFGLEQPGTYAKAQGGRAHPEAADLLLHRGHFVVRSIKASGDEHVAPVLTFKTAEGRWVRLLTGDTSWAVQVDSPGIRRGRRCAPAIRAYALQVLADLLEGTLTRRSMPPLL